MVIRILDHLHHHVRAVIFYFFVSITGGRAGDGQAILKAADIAVAAADIEKNEIVMQNLAGCGGSGKYGVLCVDYTMTAICKGTGQRRGGALEMGASIIGKDDSEGAEIDIQQAVPCANRRGRRLGRRGSKAPFSQSGAPFPGNSQSSSESH